MTVMPASFDSILADPLSVALMTDLHLHIEVATVDRLAAIDAEWRDLVTRAADANAMMHPALLRAAILAYPKRKPLVLLAWQRHDGAARLSGVWAFARQRPRKSLFPIVVLRSPAFPHAYLATPVIDRGLLEPVLGAMLDTLAAIPDAPSTVAIDSMGTDGPTMAALQRVLAVRKAMPLVLESRTRPRLKSELGAEAYFKQAMSGSSRKKLRQLRHRLAREGELTSDIVRDPEMVARNLEAFLQIENAGWKGRNATSILHSPADASFFRDGFSAMARAGAAEIHCLRLDGRPLAMQLVVRAGKAAFTWKTAYDEAFARFSPGTLLFEDYTTRFLGDETLEFVDSCAEDDSGYMATWTERQPVADLRLSTVRGASLGFRLASPAERRFRKLRGVAKRLYRKMR